MSGKNKWCNSKGKMFEIMKMLDDVELKTPIRVGDIVIRTF